ncbi:F-box domain-containing protein [Mycena sanguinolenta]|uniref:F-box domain-containing protein n=1 Tax=Mycena sanguinolenta TaxID=230812 RepID=A0A8H6YPA4_9AGAR|nr:F-box domain-containing protein [Mycena sanguinolenta]
MSAEELRARILELGTKIDFHKELLKKLQNDKSLLQRQLNAVLDPVARLPVEISSEIFQQSLSPFPKLGASHIPMLLLNVCNTWKYIALSTPDLWKVIQIEFPCTDDLALLLPVWFQHARNRPVSVFLRGDLSGRLNDSVSDVIWGYGTQLRHLEALDCKDEDEEDVDIDLFGRTTVEPLPVLEHLMIRSTFDDRWYYPYQIFELLRLSPNLAECVLDNIHYPNRELADEKMVHVSLRRLTFGERKDLVRDDCDDAMLNYLTLPALEVLSLPMRTVVSADLLRFIERSAPPLQELVMGWQYPEKDIIHLHECLHLIPSLARFQMWGPEIPIVADLFAALADSPSLLPNLRRLIIHTFTLYTDFIPDSFWRTLLRMVSTRHVQLHLGFFREAPPPDIFAALQELVNDDVEIHLINGENRDIIWDGLE